MRARVWMAVAVLVLACTPAAQAAERAQDAIPPGLATATPVRASNAQPLTVTLTLKRSDQAGFERFLQRATQDHHFLTQRQLADRFGPTKRAYRSVRQWLRAHGLRITQGSDSRLTVSARGSRAQIAHAFDAGIRDYRAGSRTFYANTRNPLLPPHVQSVSGLSSAGQPSAAPSDQYTCGYRLDSSAANAKAGKLHCENLCLYDQISSSPAGTGLDAGLSLVATFAKTLGSVYGAISNYLYCIGVAGARPLPASGPTSIRRGATRPPSAPEPTPRPARRSACWSTTRSIRPTSPTG